MATLAELREQLSKRPDEQEEAEEVVRKPLISKSMLANATTLKEANKKRERIVGKFGLKNRHKPKDPPPVTLAEEEAVDLEEHYVPTQQEAWDYVNKRVADYSDRNKFFRSMWRKFQKFGRYTTPQLEAIGKSMKREPIKKIRPRILMVSRFNDLLKHLNEEVHPTLGTNNKRRKFMNDLLGIIKNVEDHEGHITVPQFRYACFLIYWLAPNFLRGIDLPDDVRGIPKGWRPE